MAKGCLIYIFNFNCNLIISISKFVQDLNCNIVFTLIGCSLPVLPSKRMIGAGELCGALYYFDLKLRANYVSKVDPKILQRRLGYASFPKIKLCV